MEKVTQARLDFLRKESGIPLWFFYLLQDDYTAHHPAITFNEALSDFHRSAVDSVYRVLYAHEAIDLAHTLNQSSIAAKLVGNLNSKLNWLAYKKWNTAAFIAVTSTTGKECLMALLPDTPANSLSRELLLQKILPFPLTESEAALVVTKIITERGNYEEALRKWLEQTNDVVALRKIYHHALHGSQIKDAAWAKWNEVGQLLILKTTALSEIRNLVPLLPSGGPALELAAKKALTLPL